MQWCGVLRSEVLSVERECLHPDMFTDVYKNITEGTPGWNALKTSESKELFQWEEDSTYIHNPPFFQVSAS